MTYHEVQIRRQIKEMGYKLKYANNQYFIKGYTGGLSFDNLEQIEKWLAQVKEKEKKEKEEYEQKMISLNDKAIFPIYTEDSKKAFFECIKENKSRIRENKQDFEKIFDENSELYNYYLNFDVENILSNINRSEYYRDNDLGSAVYTDMEGYYFSELRRLNPDIDEEFIQDLPDYDFVSFYYKVLEHIQIEELKKYIMNLADHD